MRALLATAFTVLAALAALVTAQPTINAFGRSWFVKDTGAGRALPGPCIWSAANVRPTGDGLYLSVAPVGGNCGGDWSSAEVWLTQSLGYGTYLFAVEGPLDWLDKQVTLGLFLWDDISPDAPSRFYRESDIEVSRWGRDHDWESTSGQFVLQPASDPANLFRFPLGAAATRRGAGAGSGPCNDPNLGAFSGAAVNQITCVLQWGPGQLRWACWDGLYGLGNLPGRAGLLASWTFPRGGQVPNTGNERVHLNLWSCNWGGRPDGGRRVNVLIRNFAHTPALPDLGVPAAFPGTGAWMGRGLAAGEGKAASNVSKAHMPEESLVPPPATLSQLRDAVLAASVSKGGRHLSERDASLVLGTLGLLEAAQAAEAASHAAADAEALPASMEAVKEAPAPAAGSAKEAAPQPKTATATPAPAQHPKKEVPAPAAPHGKDTATASPSPSPQQAAALPHKGGGVPAPAPGTDPAVAWLLAMPLLGEAGGVTGDTSTPPRRLADALGVALPAPASSSPFDVSANSPRGLAGEGSTSGKPEALTKAGLPVKLGKDCPFFAGSDAHASGIKEKETGKAGTNPGAGGKADAPAPATPRSLAAAAADYYTNSIMPSRPLLRGALAVAVAAAMLASLAALGNSLKKVIAGGHRPAVFRTPLAATAAPTSSGGFLSAPRGLAHLFAGGAGMGRGSGEAGGTSSSSSSAVSPLEANGGGVHPTFEEEGEGSVHHAGRGQPGPGQHQRPAAAAGGHGAGSGGVRNRAASRGEGAHPPSSPLLSSGETD